MDIPKQIIRKWCEMCGCVTPPMADGSCKHCAERGAEYAVIAAAEAWRDKPPNKDYHEGLDLVAAIDALRKIREAQ